MAPEAMTAVQRSISYLEKKYGKGIVMTLNGLVDKKECIPSGHPFIDYVLGGGFFFGKHIELYGYESSGKSTLAYTVAANCQRMKFNTGRVLLLDYENAWSKRYFTRLGGQTDGDKLIVSQPDFAEEGLEVMREFIDSELVDLIIVDSVSAMLPRIDSALFLDSSGNETGDSSKGKQQGEMGGGRIGSQATMMSKGLQQLSARINKKRVCVIWINQVRTKINTNRPSEDTTSGGNALRFYAAVRLELRKQGAIKGQIYDPFTQQKKEGIIALRTIVKGAKNKEASPFREAPITIRFGTGIDVEDGILDFAVKQKLIKKSEKGGWYFTQELGAKRNARGLEDFRKLMKEEPEIWKAIVAKCDFEKAMEGTDLIVVPELSEAMPAGFEPTSSGDPVDVDQILGVKPDETPVGLVDEPTIVEPVKVNLPDNPTPAQVSVSTI